MNIKDNFNSSVTLTPVKPNVTEEGYYVAPQLKEDLEGIVKTITHIERFGTQMGHRNYIMIGPPGTGKTLGVQYIATRLNLPLFDAKGISTPQQVIELYKQLRASTQNGKNKVLVMLDEMDKHSSRDELIDPSQQQTLNQLLVEMDGTESNNGIFMFGMTNKPEKIDNALRRPGRFSKEIEFMPPNKEGRLAILRMHANKKGGHKFEVKDEDLEYMATLSFGYTGADLRGLLDESFTRATLRDTTKVTKEDLEFALKRIKPSAIRDMPFEEPKKKLADIGGYTTHKEIIRKIVERGKGGLVLAYGPAGTGKTLMPEAVAGEYGLNYLVVHGNDPEESLVGKTKDKLKKYVGRAKQLAPCVLLFDEIGSLTSQKVWTGGTKEGHTGYLQSVLANPPEGVLIFATENRPDMLQDTFVQRFPHKLYFGVPTAEEQEQIWRKYLPAEIDPKQIIAVNNQLTGRNIAQTALLIKDYGLEPTLEVYQHLVTNIKPSDEIDYERIRNQIGDATRDYESVKKFLNGKAGGQNAKA